MQNSQGWKGNSPALRTTRSKNLIHYEEALNIILGNTPSKEVSGPWPILSVSGFAIAEDIFADRDIPPFHRATMDGYAVWLEEGNHPKKFSVVGELYAGDNPNNLSNFSKNDCIKIMTGAPLPQSFNSVIKVEDVNANEKEIEVKIDNLSPWMNIAKKGEDSLKGNLLVAKNSRITTSVISVATSCGTTNVKIYSPPKISILTTGNEVVPPTTIPLPQQIRNTNLYTLKAMLSENKLEPEKCLHTSDSPEDIKKAVDELLSVSDILLITGGVSAGDKDFIPQVLEHYGVEKLFHKVKIRPGKPIWFGKKGKQLVFGLPGNPVSCRVIFKVFVEPCIQKMMGLAPKEKFYLPLSDTKTKKHDLKEFFGANLLTVDRQTYLAPIKSNGSGDFIHLIHTSGLGIIEESQKSLNKNDFVEYIPWKN